MTTAQIIILVIVMIIYVVTLISLANKARIHEKYTDIPLIINIFMFITLLFISVNVIIEFNKLRENKSPCDCPQYEKIENVYILKK